MSNKMNGAGFHHSEKPPREHKTASNILKRLKTEGGSVNRLVSQLHPRRFNVKSIHNLLTITLNVEKSLDRLLDELKVFENEPRLDQFLAKVLFADLVLGRGSLPGTSKPVVAVNQYYQQNKPQFQSLASNYQHKQVEKPKFVRVNTLLTCTSDVVNNLQSQGWNLVRCTSKSYSDYLKQLESLDEYSFIPDYHVKVVFAFPPKTSFSDCQLYNDGHIFLQDKATCLAGHILAPTPGSTVLDLCAAPGMKTTHLASIMKNQGTIYSVELDEKRCQILREFVESSGATCVKVLNMDATLVDKTNCPNVDYVLLDPSCSGSGMDRIANNDQEYDLNSGRVKKLSAFQAKLLRKVLNEFRTAKRVVYSTCSLYPQENEQVVADVIANHKGKFRLVSAVEKLNNNWNNLGSLEYVGIGDKCLYARPESDYTIGFFIAVFENQQPEEISIQNGNHTSNNLEDDNNETNLVKDTVNNTKEKKIKHLKRKLEEDCEIKCDSSVESKKKKQKLEENQQIDELEQVEIVESKKKKHKKHNVEEKYDSCAIEEVEVQEIATSKKEQKKQKLVDLQNNEIEEVEIVKSKKKKHKKHSAEKEDVSHKIEQVEENSTNKKKQKLEEDQQIEHHVEDVVKSKKKKKISQ